MDDLLCTCVCAPLPCILVYKSYNNAVITNDVFLLVYVNYVTGFGKTLRMGSTRDLCNTRF